MTAQPRPPFDPDPRYVQPPEPVRPCCPWCGDEIHAGEYRDPTTGRCIDCVGRSGSLGASIVFAATIVVLAAVTGLLVAVSR